MRCLPVLLCTSVLLATGAAAQTVIASFGAAGAEALGQAQDGAVVVTGGTANAALRFLPNGTLTGSTSYGGLLLPVAVENTDRRVVMSSAFGGAVGLFDGGLVTNYVYSLECWPTDLVPIEGGKVLVAVRCVGRGSFFHVFDRNLALVDSFPVRSDAEVVGVTRRPDGSIVVCTRDPGLVAPTKLTAYTSSGSVLWDVVMPGRGGGVASDERGAIYVCQLGGLGTGLILLVFTPDGVFDHVWAGPPASPFAAVRDIASSLDGTVLYTLEGQGTVRSFGNLPTPVRSMSWGRIKQHYR